MEVIRRSTYAHADRAAVQATVAAAVETDPEPFIAQYRQHAESFGGRYVGADLFKETFAEYRQSKEARNRYNSPVHNSAAVLASTLLHRMIGERSDESRDKAVFLTGSPGAGKTTSVLSEGELAESVQVIYEGQMFNAETSIPKVQAAIDAGLKPSIIAVQPKPERALDNTFRRCDEVGRGASIGTMALIQGNLAGGLRALHSRFGEAVSVTIFDYRNPDDPVRHEGWENLKILESEGSRDDIQQRLARHLQRHRDAGTITDNCYRQAASLAPSRETLYTRGVDGQGVGEHERTEQEPRSGLSSSQARLLIGSTAQLPDLRSEELAKAHWIARQDASWSNDYDNRHGHSVASRSKNLAYQYLENLAATLEKVEVNAGVRRYPELKPYYEAIQAYEAKLTGLSAKSRKGTLAPVVAMLVKEIHSGKLRTQTDRAAEIPARKR